jgi:hypothetical protein
MRSEKVSEALNALQNRFLLCRVASLAVRGFHKPRTRVPDTMNEVLDRIAVTEPRNLFAKPDAKRKSRSLGGSSTIRNVRRRNRREESE